MQVVPIQPVPNQQLQCQLGGQAVTITLQQQAYGLFADIELGAANPVTFGQICQNLNLIVRGEYLGLVGDFCFIDMEGTDDPIYTGLGSRFLLLYLDDDELPT